MNELNFNSVTLFYGFEIETRRKLVCSTGGLV